MLRVGMVASSQMLRAAGVRRVGDQIDRDVRQRVRAVRDQRRRRARAADAELCNPEAHVIQRAESADSLQSQRLDAMPQQAS